VMNETFPAAITSLGYLHKRDKQGRPVMINVYGNINVKEAFEDVGGIDQFVRWRVQLMEQAIQGLDMESIEDLVVIHDYKGASMFKMDKNVKAASRTIISLFQNHYPEMLAKKFFINVPWFFEALYSVISTFVSERTKSKFIVLGSEPRGTLLQHIDVNSLPQQYGGFSNTGHNNNNNDNREEGKVEEALITSSHIITKELKKGDTITWEYTVTSKDIGFSTKIGEKDVITPHTRADYGAGSYVATDDVKFSLVWDNSFSLLTKKKLLYQLHVISSEATTSLEKEKEHSITTTTTLEKEEGHSTTEKGVIAEVPAGRASAPPNKEEGSITTTSSQETSYTSEVD